MKFITIACLGAALASLGSTLAHALQRTNVQYAAAPQIAWSRPSLVVDYGVQTRYALAPRGAQTAANADVLVRFEPIPTATIQAIQQTVSNLNYSQPPLTRAFATVDVVNDAAPARVFYSNVAADGSGALEVRVAAPAGGWYHQPLELVYAAYSEGNELLRSEALVQFAP